MTKLHVVREYDTLYERRERMESKNYWSWNEILVHSDVQNPLYVSDTLASQSSVPHVMASVGRCQQLLASSGVRWRMPADMPNSHKGISAGIRWQMPTSFASVGICQRMPKKSRSDAGRFQICQ